ncbi:hypothetical protein V6Z12_A10G280200 [Gossypium hirsutum]
MKDRDFTEVVPSNKLHESELDSERVKQKEMDNRVDPDRIPLARVVFQLVKVRFDDALKEAKAGDTNMQVLVGQRIAMAMMLGKRAKFDSHYCCFVEPYETSFARLVMAIDACKTAKFLLLLMLVCFIMFKASVWKVSDKHPGYNASGSDSNELKGGAK